VILSHGKPEAEAGGFVVLGHDVRHAEGIAANLGALAQFTRTEERRSGRDEQDGGDERRRTHSAHFRTNFWIRRFSGRSGVTSVT
jgi:hypothetical protein